MDPSSSPPNKFIAICLVLGTLNTWLIPYISDPFVTQEFWSNNLLLGGLVLIYCFSKKITCTNARTNPWVLLSLVWTVLVGKLTGPDPLTLPLKYFLPIWIKNQIINLITLVLGLGCVYILTISVYYDGILVIWKFFCEPNPRLNCEHFDV
jgi:hypothetical protein